MRFLKILLIICSILVIGGVFYIIFFEIARVNFSRVPLSLWIYLGAALVFSITNIIYHIKSFRFYRRKEKWQLGKKVHKLLWVGTICFSCFLLYVGFAYLYTTIQYSGYGYEMRILVTVLVFVIPGFLGFLEASLLKKRIRRLRTESNTLDEIDTIGKEAE